jgi:hypothetical protein
LFREIIVDYPENHAKLVNILWAKFRVADCQSKWYRQLPLSTGRATKRRKCCATNIYMTVPNPVWPGN